MQIHVSPEINRITEKAVGMSVNQGQFFVGVEHLFAALLDDTDCLPVTFRDTYLNKLFSVHREIQRYVWTGRVSTEQGEVFHTPRAIECTTQANKIAERLARGPATAGHLLAAMLQDKLSAPSRAMKALEMDRETCLKALMDELSRLSGQVPVRASHSAKATYGSEESEAPAPASEGAATAEGPTLESLTRSLNEVAAAGKLTPAIGRSKETMETLQILSRKTKNNVMLVGEAGVGKTQIVEGLAERLHRKRGQAGMPDYEIVELNLAALTAGTQFRGAFEEKVLALIERLKSDERLVLFIDEVHLIMGAGATDGDGMDMANLLKPVLARGEIRVIGATTVQEYRRFVEKDPAIERRFQMVRVEELSEAATYKVLRRIGPSLEKHHQVEITKEAIKAAIALTQRYMPNLNLPDKAIDVLDQACARIRMQAVAFESDGSISGTFDSGGGQRVTPHTLRKVISQITAIPLDELTADERRNLGALDKQLSKELIGQDEAVSRVVSAVKKSRAGLADPNRPDSVMLFLGPSGVGKSQLAKLLARGVFGSSSHLITFDMSEYIEEHSVSRLLGAPPGYVGSEDEGRLTGAVRSQPFSILLFDEIEKAHPRVFDIFLPIFDEGRLKDSKGREVSFKNCIIILTSNIGAELLGVSSGHDPRSALIQELHKQFRPEFINRIDEIIPFYPLLTEDVRSILRLEVNKVRSRLKDKRIGIRMYQRAYEYLAEKGYSKAFGAREIRRVVDQEVTTAVSDLILREELPRGSIIDVMMDNGQLVVRRGESVDPQKKREGVPA